MKKLIKLFSLIGVFILSLGMILLTTNKTNVKAQSVGSTKVYLPLPSGFYVYDYPTDTKLYFLYNTLDNGGNKYTTMIKFISSPETGETSINKRMRDLIESTPREIEDVSYIKQSIIYNMTADIQISLSLNDFWVYDVSTWFEQEKGLGINLKSIQHINEEALISNLYIDNISFLDLQELSNTQLKTFANDIYKAISDNADVDADFFYNHGWNVGYGVGYDEGYDDGHDIGYEDAKETYGKNVSGEWLTAEQYGSIRYEEGRQDVHSPTPVEYFLYEFDNWIIPAIAVAVFGGGLFMLFSRKREV